MTGLEVIGAEEPRREREPQGLRLWAEEMTSAAQIARGIAGTPFVPSALRVFTRGEPDLGATTANVAAALLAGRELGLEPMAALRSIHIIDGTPGLSALAVRALVVAAGHDMWLEQSSATIAVVQGRRRGSNRVQESRWTMDRAEKLGLTSRKGDNWKRQPIAMLIARATSECARLVAPETLLGLPYSAEELADGAFDDAAPDMPAENGKAPARRTAQRRRQPTTPPPPATPPASAAAAPHDEPPLDDQPAPPKPAAAEATKRSPTTAGPVAPEDLPPLDEIPHHPSFNPGEPSPAAAEDDDHHAADAITTAQLRALQAGFKAVGINDRNNRLEITRQIIGRHINTATQLTQAEASTVLDGLSVRRTQQAQQAGDNPPGVVDVPLPGGDTWHGDDDTPPFGDEPKD